MTAKVVQFANIGLVTFRKNNRSKNIRLSVKPDKSVHVTFPVYASSRDVAAFVAKNESWILLQQKKFEAKKSVFEDGAILKTKLYEVKFVRGNKNSGKRVGNTIELEISDFASENSIQFIENTLTSIYRFEAKKVLPGRLKALAEKHQFQYSKITIRNNKRNWGSCSSKNNISLNLQMMKLPDELIDYILLHELVHTEIKNHGQGFWDKLDSVTNYRAKELAKQVKKYSTYTL
ncbi:MAG: M48 family metallopeptidase [Prolixibacteraceae bacterium]|nr:M48 family metallopeptidase [Prolixibacteraceae bacterium]